MRAEHHNSCLCLWEGVELVCGSDAAARGMTLPGDVESSWLVLFIFKSL